MPIVSLVVKGKFGTTLKIFKILYEIGCGFNRSRNLNPCKFIILANWIFEKFMLADEPFGKVSSNL